MSEKEYREEELQDEKASSNEKTIDLVEWQRKNAAYLEKRAKEKASQKSDFPDLEENNHEVEGISGDLEEDQEMSSSDLSKSEVDTEESSPEIEPDAEAEEDLEEGQDQDGQEISLEEETEQEDENETSEDGPLSGELGDQKLKKVKRKPSKRQVLLAKTIPFFLIAGLALLAAAYTVSPLSKQKLVKVTGQQHVSPEQVLAATGLTQTDYTLGAVLKKEEVEKRVADHLVWVDQAELTYQFPVDFQIAIKEHSILGYVKDGMTYYPVLTSGDTIDEPVGEEALPTQTLLFKMTDLEAIRVFVGQLKKGELLGLAARIQTVELSPTQASDDLLAINMLEGHTVLVPLSEIAQKLVFYEGINKQLLVPSYIDMEVGVYTYAK